MAFHGLKYLLPA